jgi:hypothetical protein
MISGGQDSLPRRPHIIGDNQPIAFSRPPNHVT